MSTKYDFIFSYRVHKICSYYVDKRSLTPLGWSTSLKSLQWKLRRGHDSVTTIRKIVKRQLRSDDVGHLHEIAPLPRTEKKTSMMVAVNDCYHNWIPPLPLVLHSMLHKDSIDGAFMQRWPLGYFLACLLPPIWMHTLTIIGKDNICIVANK